MYYVQGIDGQVQVQRVVPSTDGDEANQQQQPNNGTPQTHPQYPPQFPGPYYPPQNYQVNSNLLQNQYLRYMMQPQIQVPMNMNPLYYQYGQIPQNMNHATMANFMVPQPQFFQQQMQQQPPPKSSQRGYSQQQREAKPSGNRRNPISYFLPDTRNSASPGSITSDGSVQSDVEKSSADDAFYLNM